MRSIALLLSVAATLGCMSTPAAPPPPPGTGGGGSSGSFGAGGAPGTAASTDLPCDVDRVLQDQCQSCHANPPLYGAPMPLVTWNDTQAPAPGDPTQHIAELMKARIHDEASPMPPSGPLDAASMKVLDDWFAAGTPEGRGDCGGEDGAGGGVPAIGPDALPCKVTKKLVAHASGGSGKYHVPEDASNLYECFTFKSPWNGTTQGTAWAPIIDDARVLHHWILYRTATAQTDGGVGPCQMPSDATFVAGWAPGGGNYVLPKDIGLELAGPDDSLILQVHYHNIAGYTDADDGSGVAFCTTDTPRRHEAGVLTLGTLDIVIPPYANGYTATGRCSSLDTQALSEPLNVIATFPHMHGLGRAFKTVINRGSDTGPAEDLVDVTHFSFDNQTFYRNDPPKVINPGDSLTTSCVYDNPSTNVVTFGERTEDEMCFDFALLYPISAITGNRSCGLL